MSEPLVMFTNYREQISYQLDASGRALVTVSDLEGMMLEHGYFLTEDDDKDD